MNKIPPKIFIPSIFTSKKEKDAVLKFRENFEKKCEEDAFLRKNADVKLSVEIESKKSDPFTLLKGIVFINSFMTFCYKGDRVWTKDGKINSIQYRDPRIGTDPTLCDDRPAIKLDGTPIEIDGEPVKNNDYMEYKFGETKNSGKPWARRQMEPDMEMYVLRTAYKSFEEKLFAILGRSPQDKFIPDCLSEETKNKVVQFLGS